MYAELLQVAKDLVDQSKNGKFGNDGSPYAFRVHAYSGSIYVSEWDPIIVDGLPRDTEISHDLFDWLGNLASVCRVETNQDEICDLAVLVMEEVVRLEPTDG